jgi:pimeloyl-ACP methyl ester carboxylesterase
MTHRNVEILIGKLATDPGFGRRFADDRASVLDELQRQGLELTPVEVEALASTDIETFQTVTASLDRRIRKVPATSQHEGNDMNTPLRHDPFDPAAHPPPSRPHDSASRGERVIIANGVELATEAFGNPSNPTLLLPQGACASMLRYPEEQCRRLAAAGLQVIRYDNRDSGRSTAYPPYQPGYTLQDMAKDALAVLDAYGVERAHFMGASQGGMIAQIAAIQDPERVSSLTLVMSTPDSSPVVGHVGGAAAATALPAPKQVVVELIQFLATVDWSSFDAAVGGYIAEAHALAGSRFPVDEDVVREYAAAEIRRARRLVSMRVNHGLAQRQSPRWRDRLGSISAPTLVIHGSEDPILPLPHGLALAKEIPGAKLIVVEGMGHDASRAVWDLMVPAAVEHTLGGARASQA